MLLGVHGNESELYSVNVEGLIVGHIKNAAKKEFLRICKGKTTVI